MERTALLQCEASSLAARLWNDYLAHADPHDSSLYPQDRRAYLYLRSKARVQRRRGNHGLARAMRRDALKCKPHA